MKMTDLASVEFWMELERFMHEKYGLNGRAYDVEGKTFTGQALWCNRLCPAVRSSPAALSAICSTAHQDIAAMASAEGSAVIGECDLGLCKIVVPVFEAGELVGTVGGCGRLMDDEELDLFLAEKTSGLSPEELGALSEGLTRMSRAQAQELADLLAAKIADLLRAPA